MYKKIYLKRKKEDSILRFHPWIFSGAIQSMDEGIKEGDIVNVYSSEDKFLAIGHYQIGSIAIRILTFINEPIDAAFWERRIHSAFNLRKNIGLYPNNETTIYRLIHGEGDFLPGLIVDIYSQTAVIQAHSIGMHQQRYEISKALEKTIPYLKNIYYKSDTTLPFKANIDAQIESGFLIGYTEENIATEYGLKFYIDWLKGQKTGFFIDQRENRKLIETYAKNRNVLNMFCYTGGFSVYALRGGAQKVVSVDSSAKAMDLTINNVRLNFPENNRHFAETEDAFKYLDNIKQGDFDLIILDPPAFAKHRNAIHNAIKGYTRLNQKAFEKIKKGGILFTFSCSQAISKEQFRLAVFTAACQAKRSVRILHQLHQPADHPINIYHPEGEYLKGLVLYVE